jgi:hypothetical protein
VGAQKPTAPTAAKWLTDREVEDVAEGCVAIYFAQGRSVEEILSSMISTSGGGVLPEDIPRVRSQVDALMSQP